MGSSESKILLYVYAPFCNYCHADRGTSDACILREGRFVIAIPSFMMASKKNQPIYIKDGVILRGDAATEAMVEKDAEEILNQSGLASHVRKRRVTATKDHHKDKGKQAVTGHSGKTEFPKAKISTSGMECKMNNVELTGATGSVSVPKMTVSACGANTSIGNVSGKGVDFSAGADVFAKATAGDSKILTAQGRLLDVDLGVSSGVTVKGMDTKVLNFSADVLQARTEVSATATAKLADVKLLNADIKGGKVSAEAEAEATAKGCDIKAANLSAAGAEFVARKEATAHAIGLEVNAASAKFTGYKHYCGASASAEAKGLKVKAATANIIGIEDKKETTAEISAVGSEVDSANFHYVGKKTGASANAQMEVKGAEVKCATVSVEGPDSSVSASANVKLGGPSARVANVDFTPQGGTDVHAVADLTAGIDAGNVKVGTHKGVGIGFSTRLQVGNICLSAGPPQLTIGPNFNLGFGSGGRSRIQKGKEGRGSSGEGVSSSGCVSGGGGGRHTEGVGGVSGSERVNGGVGGHNGGGGSGEGIGGGRIIGCGGTGDGVSRKVSGQHNGEGIEKSRKDMDALSMKKSVASSTNDIRRETRGKSASNGGYVANPIRVHHGREGINSGNGYSAYIRSSYRGRHGIDGQRSSSSSSGLRRRGINHISGDLKNINGLQSRTVSSQNSTCGDTSSIDNLHGDVLHTRSGHMYTENHEFPSNHGLNGKSIPRKSSNVIPQSTHLSTSSGFGSTHRRSYWSETDAGQDIPQNEKIFVADRSSTQSGLHDICTNDSRELRQKGYISSLVRQKQVLQDERQVSDQHETKHQSYGEQLGNLLSKKVQHIKPADDLQEGEKSVKRRKIPASREEAKIALAKHCLKLRENVEEEAQTSTSKPGSIESTPGNKGKAMSGKKNATHDDPKSASSTHDDGEASEMKPKQKPFGSKQNIHTLGCFQNESSRGVKKIGEKIHGFEA